MIISLSLACLAALDTKTVVKLETDTGAAVAGGVVSILQPAGDVSLACNASGYTAATESNHMDQRILVVQEAMTLDGKVIGQAFVAPPPSSDTDIEEVRVMASTLRVATFDPSSPFTFDPAGSRLWNAYTSPDLSTGVSHGLVGGLPNQQAVDSFSAYRSLDLSGIARAFVWETRSQVSIGDEGITLGIFAGSEADQMTGLSHVHIGEALASGPGLAVTLESIVGDYVYVTVSGELYPGLNLIGLADTAGHSGFMSLVGTSPSNLPQITAGTAAGDAGPGVPANGQACVPNDSDGPACPEAGPPDCQDGCQPWCTPSLPQDFLDILSKNITGTRPTDCGEGPTGSIVVKKDTLGGNGAVICGSCTGSAGPKKVCIRYEGTTATSFQFGWAGANTTFTTGASISTSLCDSVSAGPEECASLKVCRYERTTSFCIEEWVEYDDPDLEDEWVQTYGPFRSICGFTGNVIRHDCTFACDD